jgi:hypothetical protein
MKTATQMNQDCEALQEFEHLTADNWHGMAEADAYLVASRMASVKPLGDPACAELARAAQRLLIRTLESRLHPGSHDIGGAIMTLGPPMRSSASSKPEWMPVPGRLTRSEALTARTGGCMRRP